MTDPFAAAALEQRQQTVHEAIVSPTLSDGSTVWLHWHSTSSMDVWKPPVFTCAAVRAGLPDLLRGLAGYRAAVSGMSSYGAPAMAARHQRGWRAPSELPPHDEPRGHVATRRAVASPCTWRWPSSNLVDSLFSRGCSEHGAKRLHLKMNEIDNGNFINWKFKSPYSNQKFKYLYHT